MDKTKKIISGLCIACGFVACAEKDSFWENQHEGDRINLRSEVVQEYITRASDSGFADGSCLRYFHRIS